MAHARIVRARHSVGTCGLADAGIYVPTIAREVVNNPANINLAGFAVGDGCMGTEVLCGGGEGPYYDLQFLWGHGTVGIERVISLTYRQTLTHTHCRSATSFIDPSCKGAQKLN